MTLMLVIGVKRCYNLAQEIGVIMEAVDNKYKRWGWGALIGLGVVLLIAVIVIAVSSKNTPIKTVEGSDESTQAVANNPSNSGNKNNGGNNSNGDEGRDNEGDAKKEGTNTENNGGANSGNTNNGTNNGSKESNTHCLKHKVRNTALCHIKQKGRLAVELTLVVNYLYY